MEVGGGEVGGEEQGFKLEVGGEEVDDDGEVFGVKLEVGGEEVGKGPESYSLGWSPGLDNVSFGGVAGRLDWSLPGDICGGSIAVWFKLELSVGGRLKVRCTSLASSTPWSQRVGHGIVLNDRRRRALRLNVQTIALLSESRVKFSSSAEELA